LRLVHIDKLPILPICSKKLENRLSIPEHCTNDERLNNIPLEAVGFDDRIREVQVNSLKNELYYDDPLLIIPEYLIIISKNIHIDHYILYIIIQE
jgi:hypothetical protein